MAEERVICRACGYVNPDENNFCGRCGVFIAGSRAEEGEHWRPADQPGEPRARAQSRLIYGIALAFVFSCVVLALVVIIWRP
jgi:hypothetical protein